MRKKSLILNSVLAGLSVFTLIFLALNYYGGFTGYNFLAFLGYAGGGTITIAIIGILFALIVTCGLIVTSVLGILRDTNVLKSEKVDKVLKILNLVLAIVLVVATLATLLVILIEGAAYIGYALIINTLVAIAALVLVILNGKKEK